MPQHAVSHLPHSPYAAAQLQSCRTQPALSPKALSQGPPNQASRINACPPLARMTQRERLVRQHFAELPLLRTDAMFAASTDGN